MDKLHVTAEGYKNLEEELKKLKTIDRPNVIKAIAKIIPGIAQPEIDKVDKIFRVLLLETLLPQLEIKENIIKTKLDNKTK